MYGGTVTPSHTLPQASALSSGPPCGEGDNRCASSPHRTPRGRSSVWQSPVRATDDGRSAPPPAHARRRRSGPQAHPAARRVASGPLPSPRWRCRCRCPSPSPGSPARIDGDATDAPTPTNSTRSPLSVRVDECFKSVALTDSRLPRGLRRGSRDAAAVGIRRSPAAKPPRLGKGTGTGTAPVTGSQTAIRRPHAA